MSRPRILNDAKRSDICALVAAGVGLDGAARYAGCSVNTIRREAIRNEEFAQDLRDSEGRAQLDPLHSVRDAARSHWRAAAWLLERVNPRQFGRRKPGGCSPQEFHDVIDAIVHESVDAIADPELRERVCRRLFAAAYRASRALASEVHARLNPRRGGAPSAVSPAPYAPSEAAVEELISALNANHAKAAASLGLKNQIPDFPPTAA